ncbi:MAG: class I SAM-dependent methyltransferase [Coriobacteriia bacterium]|nr:class I SAM-dependent methyltransferase [Coriobacteriia bacterium]
MDIVQKIQQLNRLFYQQQGASFARTRAAPWQGWQRCLQVLTDAGCFAHERPYSVLDFACGNRRFEAYFQEALPDTTIDYYGIDSSLEMMAGKQGQNLDVLELLRQNRCVNDAIDAPVCDLTVSFGFMHHIFGQSMRAQLLKTMLDHTADGGHLIVSFWQFLKSPDLAQQAESVHRQALNVLATDWNSTPADLSAALQQGDYFLGWQNKEEVYRYCHSFSAAEVDQLIEQLAKQTKLIARFDADGRTKNLNHYIILEVNH